MQWGKAFKAHSTAWGPHTSQPPHVSKSLFLLCREGTSKGWPDLNQTKFDCPWVSVSRRSPVTDAPLPHLQRARITARSQGCHHRQHFLLLFGWPCDPFLLLWSLLSSAYRRRKRAGALDLIAPTTQGQIMEPPKQEGEALVMVATPWSSAPYFQCTGHAPIVQVSRFTFWSSLELSAWTLSMVSDHCISQVLVKSCRQSRDSPTELEVPPWTKREIMRFLTIMKLAFKDRIAIASPAFVPLMVCWPFVSLICNQRTFGQRETVETVCPANINVF